MNLTFIFKTDARIVKIDSNFSAISGTSIKSLRRNLQKDHTPDVTIKPVFSLRFRHFSTFNFSNSISHFSQFTVDITQRLPQRTNVETVTYNACNARHM